MRRTVELGPVAAGGTPTTEGGTGGVGALRGRVRSVEEGRREGDDGKQESRAGGCPGEGEAGNGLPTSTLSAPVTRPLPTCC